MTDGWDNSGNKAQTVHMTVAEEKDGKPREKRPEHTGKGSRLPEKMRERMWEPGQSGNPAGRPKGSRVKLGEDFVSSLQAKWHEHGDSAIDRMVHDDPGAFVRVVASILPKEFKVSTASEMTDDELHARIRQLAEMLNVELGILPPVLDLSPERPASGNLDGPEGNDTAET